MNWLHKLKFWVSTGTKVEINDEVVTEYVIRFKDIYILVDEMESGYDVLWARAPHTNVPIREFWKAVPPKGKK